MELRVEQYPYQQLLKEANRSTNELDCTILYPGMEFDSRVKWWPDEGERVTPHEGIDFCYFLDPAGDEWVATPDFQVPAMATGSVHAIVPDYLGQTLFLLHRSGRESRFLSVYAHIEVAPGILPGDRVCTAATLGTLADTSGRKNRMPNHLHFSLMLVDPVVPPEKYDWDLICFSSQAPCFINAWQWLMTEKQ